MACVVSPTAPLTKTQTLTLLTYRDSTDGNFRVT